MCTVTYVPLQEKGYFLTSNRDEAPHRAATGLMDSLLDKTRVLFPKDSEAGGTWIGVNHWGVTLCLLNGAFQLHQRRLPYRMSRGLLMLDFLKQEKPVECFLSEDLQGIEPFTLVAVSTEALWELRWDGQSRFARELNNDEPHIWSSSTLYDTAMQRKRKGWFFSSPASSLPANRMDILSFHKNGGEGDPTYAIVMNRDEVVRTVSITQVCHQADTSEMWFYDVRSGLEEKKELHG